MTMISYAQNREDVVLNRAFPPGYVGFYVDIGAGDPVVDSVTKHFYDQGWRGINVEPALAALDALKAERRRDVNLGLALGAGVGQLDFYELPTQMNGCSTASVELSEEYIRQGWEVTRRRVEMTTLGMLCEEHAADVTIDFLKVDVEGYEQEVIAGGDFHRFRPRILVIEATIPGTRVTNFHLWEQAVLDSEYHFVLFDGLNRFYVRGEEPELAESLDVPANIFDDYVTRQEAETAAGLRATQAAFEEAEEALREANSQHSALGAELAQVQADLARSQAELRDARVELAATRDALFARLEAGPAEPNL